MAARSIISPHNALTLRRCCAAARDGSSPRAPPPPPLCSRCCPRSRPCVRPPPPALHARSPTALRSRRPLRAAARANAHCKGQRPNSGSPAARPTPPPPPPSRKEVATELFTCYAGRVSTSSPPPREPADLLVVLLPCTAEVAHGGRGAAPWQRASQPARQPIAIGSRGTCASWATARCRCSCPTVQPRKSAGCRLCARSSAWAR